MRLNNNIYRLFLGLAMLLAFLLTIYGINWGLPSRWCVDEPVAGALYMLAEKSLVPKSDYFHPTFHHFILIVFFLPVLGFLKIIGYPLVSVKEAASVSWIYLAVANPTFPTSIYFIARLSSALFTVASVYLVFKISKFCYGRLTGLYSAIFLSVSMGFISVGHLAKSSALLIFMLLLTVYLCMRFYDSESFLKFVVPFFAGGLVLATKFNGGIIIFPLAYYFYKSYILETKNIQKNKIKFFLQVFLLNKLAYISILSFLAGFFIGFPALFIKFYNYISIVFTYKNRYSPSLDFPFPLIFISGICGNLLTLKDIFGLPLFLLITSGIVITLRKPSGNIGVKLILLVAVPYYLLVSSSSMPFLIKYIIPVAPFLVILSSGIVPVTFEHNYTYKKFMGFLFLIVFIFSLTYTFSLDCLYAHNDVRYKCTKWLEQNIDKNKKLIILDQPTWVVHDRLFRNYNIKVLRLSKDGEFYPQFNYQFINGEQKDINYKEFKRIIQRLQRRGGCYVIHPVFSVPDRICFWKTNEEFWQGNIPNLRLNKYKTIKEFHYQRNFFWNVNLSGYEPNKIVILSKSR